MRILVISAIVSLLSTVSLAAQAVGQEKHETVKTASGMQYTCITEGSGASPGPTDTVSVNYRGTLMNGREFDSSYKYGRPTEFRLDSVIKCWTEGMQMMKVGGKARLVCPSNIAYGDNGIPGSIPPFSTLTFEVELVGVR